VKNPAGITYNTPGTYSVKMKAWNEFGTDSITKTNYITVGNAQAPATDFTADRTVICVGDHVQFQDESDNCPTTWYWEFAPASVTFLNGSNANSQNPLVQFNDATLYTVRLTAYNGNGSNSNTKVNYIALRRLSSSLHGRFRAGTRRTILDHHEPGRRHYMGYHYHCRNQSGDTFCLDKLL